MVIRSHQHFARRGFLNMELLVAISILGLVMLPLAYGFVHEAKALKTFYRDAVAMEILDGEMEVFAAGEWRITTEGRHEYRPTAVAMTNLPSGHFVLTREAKVLRLEWLPARGRKMAREIKLP